MRVAIIHSANQGFFPRMFQDIKAAFSESGDSLLCFLPRSGKNQRTLQDNQVLFGFRWNWFVHYHFYRITGIQGIGSILSTISLIVKMSKYHPDLVNLHIINECEFCIPLLVKYLNRIAVPVVWTFHDTRPFTSRCASFEEDQCFQWIDGCRTCGERSIYTRSHVNNVKLQWRLKRRWYDKLDNLTIVTPSEWLARHVRNSFFKGRDVVVINNGIDVTAFSSPTGISIDALKDVNDTILLSVATNWEHRKGIDTIIWLSEHLPSSFRIVLVGNMAENVKQKLSERIICFPKTETKEQLIALYQSADIFINPTLADNFPTVNIEALGSGLPVVTFNTGGSAECLDEGCGLSVEKGDDAAMLSAIIEVASHPERFGREACIRRAKDFSVDQYKKYAELFNALVEKNAMSRTEV